MFEILHKYLGYASFQSLQQEIIKAIIDKKDVFVLMHRGGGKSLCCRRSLFLVERNAWGVGRIKMMMKNTDN